MIYTLPRRFSIAFAVACCSLIAACSADETASSDDGSGGNGGSGGATATGGVGNGSGGGTGGGEPGTGGSPGPNGSSGGSGVGQHSGGSPGASGGGVGTGGSSGATGGQSGAASGGSGSGGAGAGGRAGGLGSGGRAGTSGAGGRTGAGTGGTSGGGGAGGLGPNAPGGRVTGYGTVLITAKSPNEFIRLQTSMVVPPSPPATGTLFLWPGLQPNGANFKPIDNGVLQPVLTWGPACAPGKQPRAYSTWWISGQYVNTNGNVSGYTDCHGGAIMSVDVGDVLEIDMALAGTVWTQTVTDVQTGQSVDYSIDMMNQAQNLAYFVIEEYSSKPVSEVVFSDITLTFSSSAASDCKLTMRGQTDFVAVPVPSADGRSCAIQQIILHAQGGP